MVRAPIGARARARAMPARRAHGAGTYRRDREAQGALRVCRGFTRHFVAGRSVPEWGAADETGGGSRSQQRHLLQRRSRSSGANHVRDEHLLHEEADDRTARRSMRIAVRGSRKRPTRGASSTARSCSATTTSPASRSCGTTSLRRAQPPRDPGRRCDRHRGLASSPAQRAGASYEGMPAPGTGLN
jgi:hypothetical protein